MSKQLLATLIFLALLLPTYFAYRQYSTSMTIDSYEACAIASGSVVQKSYPSTCVTKFGSRFTQSIQVKPEVSSLNWQIYSNDKYHITFKYPQEWKVSEESIADTNSSITKDKKAHQIRIIDTDNRSVVLISPELPIGTGEPNILSEAYINDTKVDVYTYGMSPTNHYTNFHSQVYEFFCIDTYGTTPEITTILSTFRFTNNK